MSEKDLRVKADLVKIYDIDSLCRNSIDLIRYARGPAVQHINIIELMTNYALGRWIVEEQQNGNDRAQYGARVIEKLAEALTEEFGRGYSRETLKNCRRFYLEYQNRIDQTAFALFAVEKSQTAFTQFRQQVPFNLSWSHYLVLMRIKNLDERSFYEVEAEKNGWNVRTLQRQYSSSLYERLLINADKNKVMELSTKGQLFKIHYKEGVVTITDENDHPVEIESQDMFRYYVGSNKPEVPVAKATNLDFVTNEVGSWVVNFDYIFAIDTNSHLEKVGIVIDSELGNLEMFNNRTISVRGDWYLPENYTFMYASSDKTDEWCNKMLGACDKAARARMAQVAENPMYKSAGECRATIGNISFENYQALE